MVRRKEGPWETAVKGSWVKMMGGTHLCFGHGHWLTHTCWHLVRTIILVSLPAFLGSLSVHTQAISDFFKKKRFINIICLQLVSNWMCFVYDALVLWAGYIQVWNLAAEALDEGGTKTGQGYPKYCIREYTLHSDNSVIQCLWLTGICPSPTNYEPGLCTCEARALFLAISHTIAQLAKHSLL